MADERKIRDVLRNTLTSISVKSGLEQPVLGEHGEVCLDSERARICLLANSYAYEIEISLLLEGGARFSGDVVQKWLGEPVRAYSFNDGNVESIAGQAGVTVTNLLSRLHDDFAGSLEGLTSTLESTTEEARLSRIRSEASEAWRGEDHKRVIDLYRSIEGSLSPLERKRLQLAERQMDS